MGPVQDNLSNVLKSQTTHVVVKFLNEKSPDNKNCIELVPRSWLVFKHEKWYCYYPPRKEWSKVDKWTKMSKSKERLWTTTEILILKEAASYEKGLRRLQKFYTHDTAASTTDDLMSDSETCITRVRALNEAESQFELQNVPKLAPDSPVGTGYSVPSIDKTITGKKDRCASALGLSLADANDYTKLISILTSKIRLSEQKILREIDGAKRSIQYDIRRHTEDIKNTVALNSSQPLGTAIAQHYEILGVTLPFKTVAEFEKFDTEIGGDAEKRLSLKYIMTKNTDGKETFGRAQATILTSLLGTEVQLEYSACGRESQGKKKKKFSETETFKCMNAVLSEKYSVATKTLTSKASRWFTGAADRAGLRTRKM